MCVCTHGFEPHPHFLLFPIYFLGQSFREGVGLKFKCAYAHMGLNPIIPGMGSWYPFFTIPIPVTPIYFLHQSFSSSHFLFSPFLFSNSLLFSFFFLQNHFLWYEILDFNTAHTYNVHALILSIPYRYMYCMYTATCTLYLSSCLPSC